MEQLPMCFVQVARDSQIHFPIGLPTSQLINLSASFGDSEMHFGSSPCPPDIHRLGRLNKMSFCSFHQNS